MEAEYGANLAPVDPDLYRPAPLRGSQQLFLSEGPLLRAEFRYKPHIAGRCAFFTKFAGRAGTYAVMAISFLGKLFRSICRAVRL